MVDLHSRRTRLARRFASRSLRLLAVVAGLLTLAACDGLVDDLVPDTRRPQLSVVGWSDGDIVESDRVTIGVIANDDRRVSGVRWSTDRDPGQACSFSGDDLWTCAEVPLPYGTTTVALAAFDAAGNVGRRSLELTRPAPGDTTPPSLSIVAPDDGDVVDASQVSVTVTASDDTGVTRVSWWSTWDDGDRCSFAGGTTWTCGPMPLPEGATTVTVEAVDADGNATRRSISLSRSSGSGPGAGAFDIDHRFFDHDFTQSQLAAFELAADRWEEIVIGDLEAFPLDRGAGESCGLNEPGISTTVDDLLIFVTSDPDGEEGGVLSIAGPCLSRTSGPNEGTNAVGFMEFDAVDLAILEADGDLVETIVHELGHVLGFGTNWEFAPYYDLLDYVPSDGAPDCATASGFDVLPEYIGTGGVTAYDALGGFGDIPVEETGGIGTQCGHWDEQRFGNELMTGLLEEGQHNPLSEMTVASLEDLGLTVDRSQAEPYALPFGPAATERPGLDLAGREILLRPRGGIDPATGEVTLFGDGPFGDGP